MACGEVVKKLFSKCQVSGKTRLFLKMHKVKMQNVIRCVRFALMCAYAHVQAPPPVPINMGPCCETQFTSEGGLPIGVQCRDRADPDITVTPVTLWYTDQGHRRYD